MILTFLERKKIINTQAKACDTIPDTMVNEKKKEKKPLVMLDAANPAPDGVVETEQTGAGWAGKQATQPQTVGDGLPTLTGPQVDNIKHAPSGVKIDDLNKVPGKSTPTIAPSAINSGVLAGAPSNVVIQHMLDAERKPRTPEEQAALEKKRKRDALFAAIGDGVSALSNLYFTTKGSPSADQSKSLSKAIRDRDEKEDKEYESAMDRRIRLLKEQRAEYFRNEELKIKQGLAEAEKAAKEAKTANDLKKAEDMREYYTERNQILKEEKKAEEKRKDEEAKQKKKESDNRIADSNKRTSAYQSRISNQNKNNDKNTAANVANKQDMINKRQVSGGGGSKGGGSKGGGSKGGGSKGRGGSRGGSSKYTGPRYRATYDARTGELKGYTVSGRGTTPPTKTGGKISTGVTWKKKK